MGSPVAPRRKYNSKMTMSFSEAELDSFTKLAYALADMLIPKEVAVRTEALNVLHRTIVRRINEMSNMQQK